MDELLTITSADCWLLRSVAEENRAQTGAGNTHSAILIQMEHPKATDIGGFFICTDRGKYLGISTTLTTRNRPVKPPKPLLDTIQSASTVPPVEVMERMARRSFKPLPRKDVGLGGFYGTGRMSSSRARLSVFLKEVRLAPATIGEREARRIASEHLRPLNQGLDSVVSITFEPFVQKTYLPIMKQVLAASTYGRSKGIIENYLLPMFGKMALRDLTPLTLQTYIAGLGRSELEYESIDKIRDVLSSVLGAAVEYQLLVRNPAADLHLPMRRKGRRRSMPFVTPEQFDKLVELIPEPYASMVFVAIFTGLRVSELAGLKWNDVGENSLTIDERFCRGDWAAPKSDASNTTIPVNAAVIERIQRLKLLTVEVRAGLAVRKYRVVKSDGPEDLVFQSVRKGAPMRDNNILSRFIKPAGREIGIEWVNWRSLRTSYGTWVVKYLKADIKDAQALMRHSRAGTTLDIYAQHMPGIAARSGEQVKKTADNEGSMMQIGRNWTQPNREPPR